MSSNDATEQDFLVNAQGHRVPKELIKDVDLLRDQMIRGIMDQVDALRTQMIAFRETVASELEAFVDLASEKYGVKMGGQKGNTTFTSYDGKTQIKIAIAERLHYDERIQIAKELVDKCIHAWTEGSRSEVKALVEHAFQTDKEGRISMGRLFSLLQLKIEDPDWMRAMEALRDCMQVTDTKSHIRFYRRASVEDKFLQVSLDLKSL